MQSDSLILSPFRSGWCFWIGGMVINIFILGGSTTTRMALLESAAVAESRENKKEEAKEPHSKQRIQK